MTPIEAGIAGTILLFILFIMKMHIAFAMAVVGTIGFCYLTSVSAGSAMLSREIMGQFYNYSLAAITMFVMMGSFAFIAGIGERLYVSAHKIVGGIKGGIGIATVLGTAGFASICGSTNATAATMGRVALPEMRKYGYSDVLSTGIIASSGTLGILIPPSTVFIVYGYLTEQSIGKLFAAGIFPGIILAILFAITVHVICRINPKMGPPSNEHVPLKEKVKALAGVLDALIIFLIVIGGMFMGWFSPIEGAGIGALIALVIGLIHRKITLERLTFFIRDGLKTATMIICLIAGATVFGRFMAVTTIPFIIAGWVKTLPYSDITIIVIIFIILLLAGLFIDAMALVTLFVPVLYPIILYLELDPIWFGVVIVLVAQLGVITPPVGSNVYVVKGIAPDIPLGHIFKGVYPFLIPIFITVMLIIMFPQIALFLPAYSSF